jgi:hypothetical protein
MTKMDHVLEQLNVRAMAGSSGFAELATSSGQMELTLCVQAR